MKLSNILQQLMEGPREDYIVDKLGSKLISRMSSDPGAAKEVQQLVDQLSAMDPTNNKQYLQWIAKQYIQDQFDIADAESVFEILSNFNEYKPRLAKRDINQYRTLEQLQHEMQTTIAGDSTDNLKKSDYHNVENAKYLYTGPLGTLVIPQTEEASCELGRGTQWCTSAKNNNMFSQYNEKGDLYIWIDRSGDKFQFWFNLNEGTYMFTDEHDHELSEYHFTKLVNGIPPLKQHLTKPAVAMVERYLSTIGTGKREIEELMYQPFLVVLNWLLDMDNTQVTHYISEVLKDKVIGQLINSEKFENIYAAVKIVPMVEEVVNINIDPTPINMKIASIFINKSHSLATKELQADDIFEIRDFIKSWSYAPTKTVTENVMRAFNQPDIKESVVLYVETYVTKALREIESNPEYGWDDYFSLAFVDTEFIEDDELRARMMDI